MKRPRHESAAPPAGGLRPAPDGGAAQAAPGAALERSLQGQRLAVLGRLAAAVAHDVNNLLSVISNTAYLIQREAPEPQVQAHVDKLLRAVSVGSDLTLQLQRMAMTRPEAPRCIALEPFVSGRATLLRLLLGPRIELQLSIAPSTRQVVADATELELALMNLALNAREALGAGGHVWVRARNAEPGDAGNTSPTSPTPPTSPQVLLSFSDDGCGLDEALVALAFEPYFSTRGQQTSQGLGLTQVRAFCEHAGGSARMNSTPGLGSTVTLSLPSCTATDAAAASPG